MANEATVQTIMGGLIALLLAAFSGGAKWLYGFFRETRAAQAETDTRLRLLENAMQDQVKDHQACSHSIAAMVRDSENRAEKITTAIFQKLEKFDDTAKELSVSVAELRVEIRNGRGRNHDE